MALLFDSSRPAHGMTAIPNAPATRTFARTLALALLTTATAALAPALSHAAVHRTAAPARAHAAARSAAQSRAHRSKEVASAEATARPSKGRKAAAADDDRPQTRRGRDTASARRGHDAIASQSTRHGREAIEAARVEVAKGRAGKAHAAARPIPVETASAPEASHKQTREEASADRATADRVHAWYSSRNAVASKEDDDTVATVARPTAKPVAKAKPVIQPDLSTTPRKATLEDFQRAAQMQRQAMQAAQVERASRTTDDDDAAEATTHIPSTAPTARVAAPFVHGDLLTSAAPDQQVAAAPKQVTLPVAKLDRHLEKHPDTKPDADVLAKTPDALDGASSSRTRTIAATAVNIDAPKLDLAKPVTLKHGSAPAVAAVKAAAKKQDLDPQTAQAITEEAFDDDSTPVSTAKIAPVLAARAAAPVVRQAPDEEDDLDRATTSPVNVNLYDTTGRLRMLPPMKGTHEILVHQNQMAVADGLDRIEDDNQLAEMRRYKLLVSLPDNDAIWVNDGMPANRRYARPWTVRFLNELSKAHYARFHTPLVITSAVRTVEFQRHLVRVNGNAAPPTGDIASPHLYGQAIDLGKRGMSVTEIAWMRAYLTPVETAGKIDVEEEFQQACFHISVYRRYLGLPAKKNAPTPDALPQRKMELVKATPVAPSKHRRRLGALLAAGVR